MAEVPRLHQSEVTKYLKKTDAILKGHFILSSGRHSETYIQTAKVFQHPEIAGQLGEVMADKYRDQEVDFVISPAVGAIVFGFVVARALRSLFMFTEREAGKMTLRREFSIGSGLRGLVVEDVVTTGDSVKEVIDVVKEGGGTILGVASLIDRGGPKTFEEPLNALATIKVESYGPEECPLCREGIPYSIPGSKKSQSNLSTS